MQIDLDIKKYYSQFNPMIKNNKYEMNLRSNKTRTHLQRIY